MPMSFAPTRRPSRAESLAELGGYELHLRRERAEARSRMTERFGDDRYDELLGSFGALLEDAPSPGAVRRWRSFKVSDGVDKYLKKSLKRVLKLGRKVGDEAHAKDLHRLRIRAKRLRYELEFFAVAYKSLDKAALEAKALQDLLGEHQDACTASDRLQRYARSLRKHAGARDAGGARSARGSGAAARARSTQGLSAGMAPLRAQRRARPNRALTPRASPGDERRTPRRPTQRRTRRSLCRDRSSCSPSSCSRRCIQARKASATPPRSTRI